MHEDLGLAPKNHKEMGKFAFIKTMEYRRRMIAWTSILHFEIAFWNMPHRLIRKTRFYMIGSEPREAGGTVSISVAESFA
jgi:hypothetical protein